MSTVRKRRSHSEDSGERRAKDKGEPAEPAPPAAKPQSALTKFMTRVVVGAVMIAAFVFILYGGHMYAWGLVVVLQTLLFRELVNVRYRAAAEKNIPWFRSVQVRLLLGWTGAARRSVSTWLLTL
jgi:phosphatidate cytidylyltransferase